MTYQAYINGVLSGKYQPPPIPEIVAYEDCDDETKLFIDSIHNSEEIKQMRLDFWQLMNKDS